MSRYDRTIAAGDQITIHTSGTEIIAVETSGPVIVKPDTRGSGRTMTTGDRWEVVDPKQDRTFKQLELHNPGASAVTITVEVVHTSNDRFHKDTGGLSQLIAIAADTPWIRTPTTVTDSSETVGSASAEIVAASSATRMVKIQPRGGNIYVRLGAAASSVNGIRITDGQLYEVETTLQVQAIRDGSTDVTTWVEVHS